MLVYLGFTTINSEDNALIDIGENTIIVCENYKSKKRIVAKIGHFLKYKDKAQCKFIDFCTTEENKAINFSMIIDFLPTTVFKSKDQTILITVEASAILSANSLKEIWFCTATENSFLIYSADAFIGSNKIWDDNGALGIYEIFVNGQYGTYTGEYLK